MQHERERRDEGKRHHVAQRVEKSPQSILYASVLSRDQPREKTPPSKRRQRDGDGREDGRSQNQHREQHENRPPHDHGRGKERNEGGERETVEPERKAGCDGQLKALLGPVDVVLGVAAVLEKPDFARKPGSAKRSLRFGNGPGEKVLLRLLVQEELRRSAALRGRALDEPAFRAIGKVLVMKCAAILGEDLGPLRVKTRLGLDSRGDGPRERGINRVVSGVLALRRETNGVLGFLTEEAGEEHGGCPAFVAVLIPRLRGRPFP